jgi:hypothetical protein
VQTALLRGRASIFHFSAILATNLHDAEVQPQGAVLDFFEDKL